MGYHEQQLVVVCLKTPSELLHAAMNRFGEFFEGSTS
jgi:hypothetical protein